jgi:hypothetical protein
MKTAFRQIASLQLMIVLLSFFAAAFQKPAAQQAGMTHQLGTRRGATGAENKVA